MLQRRGDLLLLLLRSSQTTQVARYIVAPFFSFSESSDLSLCVELSQYAQVSNHVIVSRILFDDLRLTLLLLLLLLLL